MVVAFRLSAHQDNVSMRSPATHVELVFGTRISRKSNRSRRLLNETSGPIASATRYEYSRCDHCLRYPKEDTQASAIASAANRYAS